MADPDYNKVVLLIKFNDQNNSTFFYDEIMGNALSTSGTLKISTTQSKFGGSSGLFSGNSALTVSRSTLNFSTGDLTIEGWVYPTGSGSPLINCQASSNLMNLLLTTSTSGKLILSGSDVITGITFTQNTWQHVAIVRNGNTWTVYINGVSAGSATNTGAFDCSASCFIGGSNSGHYFSGYVDEVRITKGLARYTSNFTPPTDPFWTPDKAYFLLSSSLLTCAPNQFSGTAGYQVIDFNLIRSADYYDGGSVSVSGTVTCNGAPASRKVSLFVLKDKRLIAETWSDPITGVYQFVNLKDQPYFAWAYDHLRVFDVVSHLVSNNG